MTMEKAQIEHLAALAKLNLTEKDKKKYAGQLAGVLAYFQKLAELDTTGVEPLAQIASATGASVGTGDLREDKAREIFQREPCLAEAPDLHAEQYRVNQVLEKI